MICDNNCCSRCLSPAPSVVVDVVGVFPAPCEPNCWPKLDPLKLIWPKLEPLKLIWPREEPLKFNADKDPNNDADDGNDDIVRNFKELGVFSSRCNDFKIERW